MNPAAVLGNFSRQPNAGVDFSADHETEIFQDVVVRSAAARLSPRSTLTHARVNPSPPTFPLSHRGSGLFKTSRHISAIREHDLFRKRSDA